MIGRARLQPCRVQQDECLATEVRAADFSASVQLLSADQSFPYRLPRLKMRITHTSATRHSACFLNQQTTGRQNTAARSRSPKPDRATEGSRHIHRAPPGCPWDDSQTAMD